VSSKRANISQIEKYLDGKLDATAMHQLERQAQDDPFLMDALEGYEKSGVKQQQLNELQNRLQQRVIEKQRNIIPWRMVAIAASVLIVLTLGGLWIHNNQPQKQQQIAQVDKTAIKPSPLTHAPVIAENKKEIIEKSEPLAVLSSPHKSLSRKSRSINSYADAIKPQANANSDMLSAELDKADRPVTKPAEKDSTPLDEALVMAYSAKRKTVNKKATDSNIVASLAGKVPGVSLKEISAKNKIQGMVVDDRGQPLPGVVVKVKGTNTTVVTNSDGNFILNADSNKKENLTISFVGFETKELIASNNKPLKVALSPNNNSLNEVVVTGYGTQKKSTVTSSVSTVSAKTSSQNEKKNFENYIKDKAISPDGKTGTVKLSFTIGGNGALSDFKIIKSLSDAADKTAIDLVKNGPAWSSEANGQPKTVEVKIRFHKAD
jgi:TonB family protein